MATKRRAKPIYPKAGLKKNRYACLGKIKK